MHSQAYTQNKPSAVGVNEPNKTEPNFDCYNKIIRNLDRPPPNRLKFHPTYKQNDPNISSLITKPAQISPDL